MRKENLDHMVIWMQQILCLNMAKYFLHLLAKGTAVITREGSPTWKEWIKNWESKWVITDCYLLDYCCGQRSWYDLYTNKKRNLKAHFIWFSCSGYWALVCPSIKNSGWMVKSWSENKCQDLGGIRKQVCFIFMFTFFSLAIRSLMSISVIADAYL